MQAESAGAEARPSGSATRFNFPDLHTGCASDETVATRLASATLGNERLAAAVERMIGEPAEVVQFGALLTLPGDGGAGVHFDYKPYRVLGSSLHWLVTVIPLSDYTPAHGPLLVAPGAHRNTQVLPSDNARTQPVSVGTIPWGDGARGRLDPTDGPTEMLDPQLKRGDLFMFNGFTAHAAAPNTGPANRLGLCELSPPLPPWLIRAALNSARVRLRAQISSGGPRPHPPAAARCSSLRKLRGSRPRCSRTTGKMARRPSIGRCGSLRTGSRTRSASPSGMGCAQRLCARAWSPRLFLCISDRRMVWGTGVGAAGRRAGQQGRNAPE